MIWIYLSLSPLLFALLGTFTTRKESHAFQRVLKIVSWTIFGAAITVVCSILLLVIFSDPF